MLRRAPETSLYATVKTYLERLGYVAKGKVCGCDVVAVRPGKPPLLVVTELKMGFTLEFLPHGIPPAWPSHLIRPEPEKVTMSDARAGRQHR